ncbi:phage tail protein [Photobacterium sp. Hal280]|uniref:phage tail protein n=1 Tax=Photobacterium sp. Hal280 TaxID=3035163 RepID=UPI00301CBB9B
MSEAFYGEIMMMPYPYAPRGWAYCNGQQVSLMQNQVLYAVIGDRFGSDNRTYLNLPDLRARAPIGAGNGPGLTPQRLAERAGSDVVTLWEANLPEHTHQMRGAVKPISTTEAQGAVPGILIENSLVENRYSTGDPNTTLNIESLSETGQTTAHENMQPYLAINFCICIDGIYPQRP